MTSTSSLEGKRALVTGGSRGIGVAIVRRLASQGAAVAVLTRDGHLGATYELGGTPFTLTALAATISHALGTHIAYQDMPVSGSHHTGEDELLFPLLRGRAPLDPELMDRMDAQHAQVNDAVAAVGAEPSARRARTPPASGWRPSSTPRCGPDRSPG